MYRPTWEETGRVEQSKYGADVCGCSPKRDGHFLQEDAHGLDGSNRETSVEKEGQNDRETRSPYRGHVRVAFNTTKCSQ